VETNPPDRDRIKGALYGMFIGDALAMPVHWYYDREALKRDYGRVTGYLKPENPHPDSILWRSSYTPPNQTADILHDQARYWGRRDIHYHQFLQAGENTLNLKLAREWLMMPERDKIYSPHAWLEHLVWFMTSPGNHRDTYVEEYLRHFFINYGKGKDLMNCGRKDENHIGGLSLYLPVLIVFAKNREYAIKTALQHLALTHGGPAMDFGGRLIADILLDLLYKIPLEEAIVSKNIYNQPLESLLDFPDHLVVGRHFSPACYLQDSIPATLYLALKYADNPDEGLIANTMCGGDNAGRGAVLGALFGAVHGMGAWPEQWINELLHPPPVPAL
jgi:ADP-ribosylglycohydrolase